MNLNKGKTRRANDGIDIASIGLQTGQKLLLPGADKFSDARLLLLRQQRAATPAKPLKYICHRMDQMSTLLDQPVRAGAFRRIDSAWNSEDLAPLIQSQAGSYQRARFFGGLNHHYTTCQPTDDTISRRETESLRRSTYRILRQKQAVVANIPKQSCMRSRIDHINPATKDGDGSATTLKGTSMSGGINTVGGAGDDGYSSGSELSSQHGTDAASIFSGGASADYSHGRTVQAGEIATTIEEHRAVGDGTEGVGVQGTACRKQGNMEPDKLIQLTPRSLTSRSELGAISEDRNQMGANSRKFSEPSPLSQDSPRCPCLLHQTMDQGAPQTGQERQGQPIFSIRTEQHGEP